MADRNAGCEGCGSRDTVTMDGVHGRRCADCPPALDPAEAARMAARALPGTGTAGAYIRAHLPAGPFQPDPAEHLVDLGRADAAFIYLLAWLNTESRRRFATVTV